MEKEPISRTTAPTSSVPTKHHLIKATNLNATTTLIPRTRKKFGYIQSIYQLLWRHFIRQISISQWGYWGLNCKRNKSRILDRETNSNRSMQWVSQGRMKIPLTILNILAHLIGRKNSRYNNAMLHYKIITTTLYSRILYDHCWRISQCHKIALRNLHSTFQSPGTFSSNIKWGAT